MVIALHSWILWDKLESNPRNIIIIPEVKNTLASFMHSLKTFFIRRPSEELTGGISGWDRKVYRRVVAKGDKGGKILIPFTSACGILTTWDCHCDSTPIVHLTGIYLMYYHLKSLLHCLLHKLPWSLFSPMRTLSFLDPTALSWKSILSTSSPRTIAIVEQRYCSVHAH